ncbi:hypothetical protein MD484_g8246, partial [Candolleomyces efflorescens]
MSGAQKRSGVELTVAVLALKNLVEKQRQDLALQGVSEDEVENAAELNQLEIALRFLQSKVDDSQAYSFSGVAEDHLVKMGISCSGLLELKPDAVARSVEADALGGDGLWSADRLYRHLQFLDGLVPQRNEASARPWIDAYFYRVATMTRSSSNMVLNVEQVVPSVPMSGQSLPPLSGYVGWTAIATTAEKSKLFLRRPSLRDLESEDSVFFVSEAKGPNKDLVTHIPQALFEMCGCARLAGKTSIRGAVTNGVEWIFLILTLGNSGGGTYIQSDIVHNIPTFTKGVSAQGTSLISSIIAYWMIHSHEEFNADSDYFTYA